MGSFKVSLTNLINCLSVAENDLITRSTWVSTISLNSVSIQTVVKACSRQSIWDNQVFSWNPLNSEITLLQSHQKSLQSW